MMPSLGLRMREGVVLRGWVGNGAFRDSSAHYTCVIWCGRSNIHLPFLGLNKMILY